MSDSTPELTPRQAARLRNPEITARLGANIRRARLTLGMTQAELARALDEYTDASAVSRWERGKKRPLPRNLDRLSEVLEVTPDWLFSIHTDEPEEAAA